MRICSVLMVALLVIGPAFQQVALAGQTAHVVSSNDLRAAVAAQVAQRTSNIQEITRFLNHKLVQRHAGKLVDLVRIEKNLAHLDDDTLKQLAAESSAINDQLRAGINPLLLLIIFGAVAAIIIIIVANEDEALGLNPS